MSWVKLHREETVGSVELRAILDGKFFPVLFVRTWKTREETRHTGGVRPRPSPDKEKNHFLKTVLPNTPFFIRQSYFYSLSCLTIHSGFSCRVRSTKNFLLMDDR